MHGSAVQLGLISLLEVADRLGVHVKTVHAYVNEGRLRFVQVGARKRMFKPQDVDEFVDGATVLKEPPACPSTSRKTRRTGTMISSSKVEDFMAHLDRRRKQRPGKSKPANG